MTWWEAKKLARQARRVRVPGWGNAKRIVFDADNPGGVRAVAVMELIDAAGVVTRRVVRAADFAESEFRATDWEAVP